MTRTSRDARPGDLDLDEFRRVGYQVIDAMAAYHAGLADRRASPGAAPAEVAARFAEPLAFDLVRVDIDVTFHALAHEGRAIAARQPAN
jgi:hypothetical protein